jgi:hypothetical protein
MSSVKIDPFDHEYTGIYNDLPFGDQGSRTGNNWKTQGGENSITQLGDEKWQTAFRKCGIHMKQCFKEMYEHVKGRRTNFDAEFFHCYGRGNGYDRNNYHPLKIRHTRGIDDAYLRREMSQCQKEVENILQSVEPSSENQIKVSSHGSLEGVEAQVGIVDIQGSSNDSDVMVCWQIVFRKHLYEWSPREMRRARVQIAVGNFITGKRPERKFELVKFEKPGTSEASVDVDSMVTTSTQLNTRNSVGRALTGATCLSGREGPENPTKFSDPSAAQSIVTSLSEQSFHRRPSIFSSGLAWAASLIRSPITSPFGNRPASESEDLEKGGAARM